jgi:phospholipid/cholesterol/gamma-HCH transport system permease protein
MNPVFLGILGGWMAGLALPQVLNLLIAQMDFIPFHIAYAFIKTPIFAMLLATIPPFMVTT